MKTIIFIGGIPGTGKTTISYKLATLYHIDKVISLDILKNIIKLTNNNKYVNTTTHEAYKIENLSVVEGFKKHAKIINECYVPLIKTFIKDKVIIVEGATITKEFLKYFKDYNLIYINLYIRKDDVLKKRYISKSKMRKGVWNDNIKNILMINEYLKKQAIINICSDDIKLVLKKIKEYIDESIFL